MKTKQPLHCPFCGSPDPETAEDTDSVGSFFWVVCWHCEAAGPTKRTAEQAADAWNYRTATTDDHAERVSDNPCGIDYDGYAE